MEAPVHLIGRAAALGVVVVLLSACELGGQQPRALPVSQAMAAGEGEELRVRGFLVVGAAGARLCAELAESYPPQCAGPSLVVHGLDPATVPGLSSAAGTTWSDGEVTVRGRLRAGALEVG